MRISDFYKNARLKFSLRLLSVFIIVITLLTACDIQSIMAQQADSSAQPKAAYERMNTAYQQYINLLKEGKENSTEGSEAFDQYAKYKVEYENLAATNTESDSKSGAKSFSDVTSNIMDTGEKIAGDIAETVKNDIIPGSQKMSLIEKVAWGLAKSIIPTAAVLALASFAILPIGALIASSILIGAVTSGTITYFYEKRSNKFRDKEKSSMEILRDVSISAVTDGILAPFTMATGGLASTFGSASTKVIIQNALRGAAIQFAGQSISSAAGGAVKHAWAKNYFHYDQKIAALQNEANQIFAKHSGSSSDPLTETEKARLTAIATEIDEMEAQDYTTDDFKKDVQRAALSSLITGAIGTSVSGIAANSKAASLASLKLYGTVDKAGAIASYVTSNPIAFLQGSARANLEKHYINEQIKETTAVRDKYAKTSVAYAYYNDEITRLSAQNELINPWKKGLEAGVVNFAIQSVSMGVSLGKEKLVDKPQRDKQAVEQRYREQSTEWKKAAEMRQKIESFKDEKKPDPTNYTDINKYAKDKLAFNRELNKLESDAAKIEIKAYQAQSSAENQKLLESVKLDYQKEQQLERNLEYARVMGQENYLKAFKLKMRETNEKYSEMSDDELGVIAKNEIASQNKIAYDKSKAELAEINENLAKARIIKGKDGSDVDTLDSLKEFIDGKKDLSSAELRSIEIQAAKISPSVYKAKLVSVKVNEMKYNGATDDQIVKASDQIYAEAEKQMLKQYGNSWTKVICSEMASTQLQQLRYSDDGKMSLREQLSKIIRKEAPEQVESQFVSHYRTEVNDTIKNNIMPGSTVVSGSDIGSLFINTSISTLFSKVLIDEGSSKLFDSAYKGAKQTITAPVNSIKQNVLTPAEIQTIRQNNSSK